MEGPWTAEWTADVSGLEWKKIITPVAVLLIILAIIIMVKTETQQFALRPRVLKLNPKKRIHEKAAETLKSILKTDSRFRFALPLDNITLLDFEPPKPSLPEKNSITKHILSKALQAASIDHSYMSMKDKLVKLPLRQLKGFCEAAGIASKKYKYARDAEKVVRLLWEVVEAADEEKPKNLSRKEISAILKENNIKAWSKTLKERFALLPLETLVKVAECKGIDGALSLSEREAKEELVERIWKDKESYDHRKRLYKMRRHLQDIKAMLTRKGIEKYLRLRKDFAKATIRRLHFRLKPYTFFLEEVWCCGEVEGHLFFCIAPTISEVSFTKYL